MSGTHGCAERVLYTPILKIFDGTKYHSYKNMCPLIVYIHARVGSARSDVVTRPCNYILRSTRTRTGVHKLWQPGTPLAGFGCPRRCEQAGRGRRSNGRRRRSSPNHRERNALAGMAKATLWINQLPFSTSQADVAAHFAKAAGVPSSTLLPSVRLVMKGGKFNGTAFVDLIGWDAVDRGVALHQSRFKAADGACRRINVREAVSKSQLEVLSDRSKANQGKVLAKAYGGATKAKPLPDDAIAEDDDASGQEDESKDEVPTGALGKECVSSPCTNCDVLVCGVAPAL